MEQIDKLIINPSAFGGFGASFPYEEPKAEVKVIGGDDDCSDGGCGSSGGGSVGDDGGGDDDSNDDYDKME